jgi:ribosome recycling factor
MSFDADLTDCKNRFEKALTALVNDFKHLRTGRASVAMIEHVQVSAYDSILPITQCASISVPEPTQLLIKPWDKGLLKAIEKALSEAQLGMTPNSDGIVIRLIVPPLSGERRQQMAVQGKESCEKCKVSLRNLRRDAIKAVEAKGKAEKASEDLVKKTDEKITELLKQYEAKAETALKNKIADITSM